MFLLMHRLGLLYPGQNKKSINMRGLIPGIGLLLLRLIVKRLIGMIMILVPNI